MQPGLDSAATFQTTLPALFSDRWSDAPFFGPTYARIEEIGEPVVRPPQHSILQEPTPPRETLELPNVSAAGDSAASSQKSTHKPMTSGQASLYNALFSLARPGEDYYTPPNSICRIPRNAEQSLPTPFTEQGSEGQPFFAPDDTGDVADGDVEDPEGVKTIMLRSLPLDHSVESNTLPFMLESCKFLHSQKA
ncbi:hypothetical protein BN14_08133 [Rhizoctonia solani AG-1 IB]|uniref:Uncharacterized protein n=1 Tax=Thanatephorus cucumeris (strain AG1-IB / isolate 7/3/14) TaxID=1108050 RepID=M5C3P3_THACB|nr:hypothetical protein BN14_08133 [Rhizoctonia solani AG-1 IB]